MATKKEFIKFTAAGRSVIVVIDKEKFIFTTTEKEIRDKIKKQVDSFNNIPSENKKKKLIKDLTPKTTAKAVAKVAEKKLLKNKVKEATKEVKQLSKTIKGSDTESTPVVITKTFLDTVGKDKRFSIVANSVFLVPFKIALPQKLVDKMHDFIIRGEDLKPLINFWKLCLLNPNPIARTKLFDYLTLHNLIITPNGYFVTYRMVKTTENPGIYTHHHNGDPRLYYEVGKIAKLDRALHCDEDGSKDCSRGIHFGSPAFIGIVDKVVSYREDKNGVGSGYGTKIVTTKAAHPQSYGTGYDAPAKTTEQKFDNTFGNQATLWLVNPMHVVSIPFSDTRKMRACEGYFAKLTTAEEVIQHVIDPDYLLFDDQYKQYEEEEINAMLKQTKITSYVNSLNRAKTEKAQAIALDNLRELQGKLKISNDAVSEDNLSLQDINLIIQSRVKK